MTTQRESQALAFIKAYSLEKCIPPSYREIADHLGLVSTSGVARILESLIEQGLVRKKTGARAVKHRCIEIVHAPVETWLHIGELASKLVASIKDERIDDNGEGDIVVDAKAFGDLDIAIKEASETSPQKPKKET